MTERGGVLSLGPYQPPQRNNPWQRANPPPRQNNPQPPPSGYNLPPYYHPALPPGPFRPPQYPSPQPYRYPGWLLAGLILGYLISMVFLFLNMTVTSSVSNSTAATSSSPGILSSCAMVLLLFVHGVILVIDGRSFFTLYGKLQWRRKKIWLKIILALVYLSLFVMPAIYLVLATQHFLRGRKQTLGEALRDGWLWYRRKTPRTQLVLALCATILIISGVVGTSLAAMSDRETALALLTPTPSPTQALVPTATATNTPAPSSIPTATPTAQPVSTTPPPTPTPIPISCVAVNNNPWCYNYSPGNLIYAPPSNFCDFFNCIASFWEPDDPGDGYVVQCADTTFSQSGGERGACSRHGGVSRPLYSH